MISGFNTKISKTVLLGNMYFHCCYIYTCSFKKIFQMQGIILNLPLDEADKLPKHQLKNKTKDAGNSL